MVLNCLTLLRACIEGGRGCSKAKRSQHSYTLTHCNASVPQGRADVPTEMNWTLKKGLAIHVRFPIGLTDLCTTAPQDRVGHAVACLGDQ
jgi:hypothetical protein